MALRDETKACPVCNAVTFADMPTCFNCMHSFAEDERPEPKTQNEAVREGGPPKTCTGVGGEGCLLGEFLVQFEGFLREFVVDRKVDV